MTAARYDGHADWYDETFRSNGDLAVPTSSAALVARLLGPGDGWCLDVACGTGLNAAAIASTGRKVVGVDVSADQLRLARTRVDVALRADATRLPLRSRSFTGVVCTFLHTDLDDLAGAFGEIARVLVPGGRFVYVGVHPCFRGHFVEIGTDRRVVHPGYHDVGWRTDSPHRTWTGIRERVGAHHRTLSDLVGALVTSGLRLTGVDEGDPAAPFADVLALTATR